MNFTPKVSVLIPTYNYAHYLDEAIKSVLDQTYSNFELIIVDDKSSDNTIDVVQKFLNDSRVSFYVNSTNVGLVQNFNRCLEYATGDYIKYLMADDVFDVRLLEKYVAIMEQFPNVALVTAYRKFFGLHAEKKQEYPPFTHLQEGRKVIYESLNSHNWIGEPTTVMFRRANLHIGEFNTNYSWIPDWDMWIRQLTLGDCYIIPETLSYFRQHVGQASVALTKNYRRFFEEYSFFKNIQNDNKYNFDLSKVAIDKIIKRKASICSRSAIKLIPKLFSNRYSRQLFFQGMKLTVKEKVFFGF